MEKNRWILDSFLGKLIKKKQVLKENNFIFFTEILKLQSKLIYQRFLSF